MWNNIYNFRRGILAGRLHLLKLSGVCTSDSSPYVFTDVWLFHASKLGKSIMELSFEFFLVGWTQADLCLLRSKKIAIGDWRIDVPSKEALLCAGFIAVFNSQPTRAIDRRIWTAFPIAVFRLWILALHSQVFFHSWTCLFLRVEILVCSFWVNSSNSFLPSDFIYSITRQPGLLFPANSNKRKQVKTKPSKTVRLLLKSTKSQLNLAKNKIKFTLIW